MLEFSIGLLGCSWHMLAPPFHHKLQSPCRGRSGTSPRSTITSKAWRVARTDVKFWGVREKADWIAWNGLGENEWSTIKCEFSHVFSPNFTINFRKKIWRINQLVIAKWRRHLGRDLKTPVSPAFCWSMTFGPTWALRPANWPGKVCDECLNKEKTIIEYLRMFHHHDFWIFLAWK